MTDWKQLSSRFADEFIDLPLNREAGCFLDQLPSGTPVLAACSGGADSVFLVLALMAHLQGAAQRLHILHFNHRLRDTASDADEAFVAALAAGLGLPLHCGHATPPVPTDEHSLRAVRYGWMAAVYQETRAGALCLGQHADDLIESQLMALFSGSGPAGLAAPPPVKAFSDGHVRLRPLISLRRRQIETALRALGLDWREDASNSDTRYTRNWIRHQLVPNLLAGFPQDIYAGSAHTQRLMLESVEAIDAWLGQAPLNFADACRIDLAPVKGQPRALVRRAIMAWWMRHHAGERLEAAVLEGILAGMATGRKTTLSIGANRVLLLDAGGALQIGSERPEQPHHWPACRWHWPSGPLFLPDGAHLCAQRVEWGGPAGAQVPGFAKADPAREAWISLQDNALRVRQWQDGDRYRPLGAPGRRKLQDLFTDAKLSAEQKRRLPVLLTEGDEIVWVPGFPPADAFRIGQGCNSALKLTYNMQ